jgi:signal transduction histidine kinase
MRERIRDMGGIVEVRSSAQGLSIHVSLLRSAGAHAAGA